MPSHRTEVVDVYPDVCLTIPLGVHFQFRSFGFDQLAAVGVTMPPWPGEGNRCRTWKVAVYGAWMIDRMKCLDAPAQALRNAARSSITHSQTK